MLSAIENQVGIENMLHVLDLSIKKGSILRSIFVEMSICLCNLCNHFIQLKLLPFVRGN